jgi:hypothetical protein
MTKNIFIIAGYCAALAFLVGCGYTTEEKEAMASNEELGKEIITGYIQDKYGFTPSFESVISEKEETGPVPNLWPDATGYIMAKCTYEDASFNVVAKAETGTDEIWDNYEYDIIKNAVSDAFHTSLGTEALDLYIRYGREDSYAETGLIHDRFTTLPELYSETKFNIVYNTLDGSDQYIGSEELIDMLPASSDIVVVTYKDESSYEDCPDKDLGINGYPITGSIKNSSIYISEYFTLSESGGYSHTNYKTQTIEDSGYTWYFVYSDTDIGGVEITPAGAIDPTDWNGRGFKSAEPIGGVYHITFLDADGNVMESGGSVNIFIETEQVADHEEYSIVSGYMDGSDTKRSTIPTMQAGDKYITGTIYNKDDLIVTLLGEEQGAD